MQRLRHFSVNYGVRRRSRRDKDAVKHESGLLLHRKRRFFLALWHWCTAVGTQFWASIPLFSGSRFMRRVFKKKKEKKGGKMWEETFNTFHPWPPARTVPECFSSAWTVAPHFLFPRLSHKQTAHPQWSVPFISNAWANIMLSFSYIFFLFSLKISQVCKNDFATNFVE